MDVLEFKKYLIQTKIKPLFKQEGFEVSGTHWRKRESGFVKVFNLQLSQFNSMMGFKFFINIGLFFPDSYQLEFTNDFFGGIIPDVTKVIKNPKVQSCQFHSRDTDIFKRQRDYTFNKNTNPDDFEKYVIEDIKNEYLPFFNKINSIEDCAIFFKEFYPRPMHEYCIALGLAATNKKDEAKIKLGKLIKENQPSKVFITVLKEELNRLGIDYVVPEIKNTNDNDPLIDFSKGSYP